MIYKIHQMTVGVGVLEKNIVNWNPEINGTNNNNFGIKKDNTEKEYCTVL